MLIPKKIEDSFDGVPVIFVNGGGGFGCSHSAAITVSFRAFTWFLFIFIISINNVSK